MPEIQINPFTTQGMIRDPRLFFGRKTELASIWGYLRKDANVSIVAERRMGKSSLLWYVKEMAKNNLESGTSVHYIDMELVADMEDFLSRLAELLQVDGATTRDIERALSNQRLILCIDEFDRTAHNTDSFPRDFFAVLRGLSQGPALTLAIATKTPLIDFSASGGMTSPFYNIFPPAPLALGKLENDEARDLLIETAARGQIKFSPEVIENAIQLSKGYPWRLQLLGYYLVESGLKLDEARGRFEKAIEEEEFKEKSAAGGIPETKDTIRKMEGGWEIKEAKSDHPNTLQDRLALIAAVLTFAASVFAFYAMIARDAISMFIAVGLALGIVAGYIWSRLKLRRG